MPDPAADRSPLVDRLAVIGVGLIGGSIALAAKQRGVASTVIGLGRSRERLKAAREAGLLDEIGNDPEVLAEADLVVVCTPVDRIVADVRRAAAVVGGDALITDAGSIKASICTPLSDLPGGGPTFIGSHPLAGSERSGWEHAAADLFEGRVCVLTATSQAAPEQISRLDAFWQSLGMRTMRLLPEEHDRALARTSHLPHAAAAALASLLSEGDRDLAATGFRDTTRIAAGDPAVWAPIFLMNSGPISEEIDRLAQRLKTLRKVIDSADASRLERFLSEAKQVRDSLDDDGA